MEAMHSGRRANIVVDPQKAFEIGWLPVPNARQIIPAVNNLMIRTKQRAGLVVASFDWHTPWHISFASTHGIPPFTMYDGDIRWPDHAVIGTPEVETIDGIDETLFGRRVYKIDETCHHYSAFWGIYFEGGDPSNGGTPNGTLDELLRWEGITDVDIDGLALDYCVKDTVLDALRLKYRTRIHLAGCRAVAPDTGRQAIEQMRAAGAEIVE